MIHEQKQSSLRHLPSDNIDMVLPSSVKDSTNNTHPKPELPGYMLNSLSELKDHGFDSDSNAPAFYWSKHQLPWSGERNLTAKSFALPTHQVTNEEARFSLTISSMLIQLTESQREMFADSMLRAANRRHPQLSILGNTCVATSEDDFQKIYRSCHNAVVPNLPHLIPKTSADGTHVFCWIIRSSCQ